MQPQKIVDILLERFKIDGVVAMTPNDIKQCIVEILNSSTGPMATIASSIAIQGAILQRIEERGCGPVLQTPTVVQPSTIEGVPTYKAFRWNSDDGQVEHTVPEGFEYPSYTVGIMFNLWFFGDLPRFLRPFKEIPGVDLPTKLCKTNYSRCKKVISA